MNIMNTELKQIREKVNKKMEIINAEENILAELKDINRKLNLCKDKEDLTSLSIRLQHSTDKVTWTRVSKQPLSIEFMFYFEDKINWVAIALHHPNIDDVKKYFGHKLPKNILEMRKNNFQS